MKSKVLFLIILLLVIFGSFRVFFSGESYDLTFDNNARAVSSVLILIHSLDSTAYEEIKTLLLRNPDGFPVVDLLNDEFLSLYLKPGDLELISNFKKNFFDPWGSSYFILMDNSGELLFVSSGPNRNLGDKDDMEKEVEKID